MDTNIEKTLSQYEHMFYLPIQNRADYFRYTMMNPFAAMWETIQVPMKPKQPGGYDIMLATEMLGYLNVEQSELGLAAVQQLRQCQIEQLAEETLFHCIAKMREADLHVRADKLQFGIYIADPEKLAYTQGYSGFGGIPGFIQLILYPNAYNISKIPAIIAHEFHHNIRFSYFNWDHGHVSVGEYIVIEGLADTFASELYGQQQLGPWVTDFDEEDLKYSIEVIGQALEVKGFAEVSSYMFGDEIGKERGYAPVGLSFAAGYAVGYYVVQQYMKETGATVYEATKQEANEIIAGSKVFKHNKA